MDKLVIKVGFSVGFFNKIAKEKQRIDYLDRLGKKTGIGKGKGMSGGLRRMKNIEPCPEGGPGKGSGSGRGAGKVRDSVKKKTKKTKKKVE